MSNTDMMREIMNENQKLKGQLLEITEHLDAFQLGSVDAFIMNSSGAQKEIFHRTGVNESYRILIQEMDEGALIVDHKGNIVFANESFSQMIGFPLQKILGKSICDYLNPRDCDILKTLFNESTHDRIRFEAMLESLRCKPITVSLSCRKASIIEGQIHYFLVAADITEHKRLIADLDIKRLFETTLASVRDGVISCDLDGNVVFMNRTALDLTETDCTQYVGKAVHEIFKVLDETNGSPVEDLLEVSEIDRFDMTTLVSYGVLKDVHGVQRFVEYSVSPILEDEMTIKGTVIVFRDISVERQRQREIEYLSYHDPLTGLYNRRFYEEELKRVDTLRNLPLSLIVMDVNGLKLVNDAYGHDLGDVLLKRAAKVIQRTCRSDEIVARFGGDEFVLLLPKTDEQGTERIIERMYENLAKERIGNIPVSLSIGSATKQFSSDDVRYIFQQAEERMYHAKLSESYEIRARNITMIKESLFEKQPEEESHAHRVGKLSTKLGKLIGLRADEIEQIELAATMHDIGKISLPPDLLNKTGDFTIQEWHELQKHPEIGYRILSSISDFSQIANVVLYHHERWDGRGYPTGIRGESIPVESRIIAIADAYDDMITERPYKQAISKSQAINELLRSSGTHFDPTLVDLFINSVL